MDYRKQGISHASVKNSDKSAGVKIINYMKIRKIETSNGWFLVFEPSCSPSSCFQYLSYLTVNINLLHYWERHQKGLNQWHIDIFISCLSTERWRAVNKACSHGKIVTVNTFWSTQNVSCWYKFPQFTGNMFSVFCGPNNAILLIQYYNLKLEQCLWKFFIILH